MPGHSPAALGFSKSWTGGEKYIADASMMIIVAIIANPWRVRAVDGMVAFTIDPLGYSLG